MRQKGQWERNGSPAREKAVEKKASKSMTLLLEAASNSPGIACMFARGRGRYRGAGRGRGGRRRRATRRVCVSDQGLVGSPERSTVRARQTKVKDKVRQYLSRDRSRAHRSRAGARGDSWGRAHAHCTHSRPPHREVLKLDWSAAGTEPERSAPARKGNRRLKMPDRALVSLLWLKDPHPKLGTLV